MFDDIADVVARANARSSNGTASPCLHCRFQPRAWTAFEAADLGCCACCSALLQTLLGAPRCQCSQCPNRSAQRPPSPTTHHECSTTNALRRCLLASEDLSLARAISSLWGAFGWNHSFSPSAWPQFAPPRELAAQLDLGAVPGALDTDSGYRRRQCEALERLGLVGADDVWAVIRNQQTCGK